MKRPRDPWVFRSVLDKRPRMITVALHEKMWVAYDATDASLYKVFPGGVNFTGSVYDTKHGPQPQAMGEAYYTAGDAPSWRPRRDGTQLVGRLRFLGYTVDGTTSVTIRTECTLDEGGTFVVTESPSYSETGGNSSLRRTFTLDGLPAGVTLDVPLGRINVPPATTQPATTQSTTAPSVAHHAVEGAGKLIEPERDDGDRVLRIAGNGRTTLITTWEAR